MCLQRRPIQKPTLHYNNISGPEPAVAKLICTRTETRVDSGISGQRDLLLLKLGTNSYVLDIYGFSIAVQICGTISRYTFMIPHAQEKKGASNYKFYKLPHPLLAISSRRPAPCGCEGRIAASERIGCPFLRVLPDPK